MTTFTQLTSASSHPPEPVTDQLRLAVAAYLARFKASSRAHTESDLHCYLSWCTEQGLGDPVTAQTPLELVSFVRCDCVCLSGLTAASVERN